MSLWTLTFQIANFLVLAALLQRFLFKPVTAMIARRQEALERAAQENARTRQETEAVRKGIEDEKARLGAERDLAIAGARTEIERERGDLIAKARAEAAAVVDAARKDVDAERALALESMVNESLDIAVGIARRLLADVGTKRVVESFLDRICEHLDALPPERLDALAKELDGHELSVATAPLLSSEEQVRWSAKIATRLGHGIKAGFVSDDALVLGAELRFPLTTLSYCWRDSLRAAREELGHRAQPS